MYFLKKEEELKTQTETENHSSDELNNFDEGYSSSLSYDEEELEGVDNVPNDYLGS